MKYDIAAFQIARVTTDLKDLYNHPRLAQVTNNESNNRIISLAEMRAGGLSGAAGCRTEPWDFCLRD